MLTWMSVLSIFALFKHTDELKKIEVSANG